MRATAKSRLNIAITPIFIGSSELAHAGESPLSAKRAAGKKSAAELKNRYYLQNIHGKS
jgi:hypothetical protein